MDRGVVINVIDVDSELQVGVVNARGGSDQYAFFQDLTTHTSVHRGERVTYELKDFKPFSIDVTKRVAVDLREETI